MVPHELLGGVGTVYYYSFDELPFSNGFWESVVSAGVMQRAVPDKLARYCVQRMVPEREYICCERYETPEECGRGIDVDRLGGTVSANVQFVDFTTEEQAPSAWEKRDRAINFIPEDELDPLTAHKEEMIVYDPISRSHEIFDFSIRENDDTHLDSI
ncbi:hypothetical protein M501DRAFT_1031292 [Patellaria atrata CBS 101060]|uniref:Uncharacterized protein n=1 Tax=Patellaria atrata CBS 101060 TaxID=1346257 RepID=A0A9P4SAP5_9PEZI|nr:hypothetical protein M501DRAFT_1031292 [Patellaria atrata CBS 101060]